MQVSTIRPGILVALSTTVKGNVSYKTKTIEEEHQEEDGALVSLWETEKSIADKDEHDRAIKTRTACRGLIIRHCSATSFGLLCPESRMNALLDGVAEAQEKAREFNAESKLSRINVSVILGKIAQDDVQAVMAINGEVANLIDRMEQGVQALDVQSIRDAANRLRGVGSMLSEGSSERVQDVIKQARAFASKVAKAAETGTAEVDAAVLAKLRQERSAFLDLEASGELTLPSAAAHTRAIDLEPEVQAEASAEAASEGEKIVTAALEIGEFDGDAAWQGMLEYGEVWWMHSGAREPSQDEARAILRDATGETIPDDAEIKITASTPVPARTSREAVPAIDL